MVSAEGFSVDAPPKTTKAALSTFRSPPQNNDVLKVYDKALCEQGIEDEINFSEAVGRDKSSNILDDQSGHLGTTKASPPQGRSEKEVKLAGFKAKMADAEERRKEDQKKVREQLVKFRQMREQRFERLIDGVFEDEKLVMKASTILRHKES